MVSPTRWRTFVDSVASLREPRTLMLGVVSGYAVTACFAALLAIALATHALPWHWLFGVCLAAKLLSNTAAFVAIKLDRWTLEVSGINTAMDAVVMTGAIWATGDTASPLIAIYTLNVVILSLLTNLTVTLLVGGFTIVLYVTMGLLVDNGVLPSFPTPVEWRGRDASFLVFAFTFVAFVIAAPTFYTAGMLRRLRDKERRLAAQQQALIEAGKQKAQFMSNMTHELRTPLQGIMGLSDLVAKNIYGPTSDKQRDAMRDIKASSKRLLGLIDDLLQLASHDAGKLDLHLVEVDLGELLPSSVANTQWLLAGKSLSIDLELADGLPVIQTDRGKLNQIVLDLVANAIKFTPDGGSIVVSAAKLDDTLEIAVRDTGVGIPAHQLAHIFDEFHQVDGSSSREFGGVGIGLALVKRLANLIGATVTVESEVSRGSTFRVRLPLA